MYYITNNTNSLNLYYSIFITDTMAYLYEIIIFQNKRELQKIEISTFRYAGLHLKEIMDIDYINKRIESEFCYDTISCLTDLKLLDRFKIA